MNDEEICAMVAEQKTLADEGDAQAAYAVAALSLMTNDYETVLKYALQSVELSSGMNHEALHILGDCYKFGLACDKDIAKAFEFFTQASELGNDEAQYKLGMFYVNGDIVEKDIDKAIYWFARSASAGNDMGKFYLDHVTAARESGIEITITRQT